MLSKLLKVTIEVCITWKSTFKGFAPKDAAWKTNFFAKVVSQKKVQINKSNYGTIFSLQNKSVCQNLP